MKRLVLLAALGLATATGCSDSAEPAAPKGPRPRVVLILVDTLRADVLSFYGADEERAPFLSSLAKEATVFERTWSTSSWTAPSSASVMTGVYPDRHGVTSGFLAQFKNQGEAVDETALGEMQLLSIARDVPTLAERMKGLGYETFAVASNLNIGSELEFDRGFDHFHRSQNSVPAGVLFKQLREWKPLMEDGDAPCFLYLHLNDVHVPYDIRPRFFRDDPSADELARSFEAYKSELGFLDFVVSNMYRELGWDEDTLLVFVADHGEEFRDHGGLYHEFTIYDEVSRVPFFVHGPTLGVTPGRVARNTSLIDVAPTILGLLGAPIDEQVDGRSLAELCRAERKGEPGELDEALVKRPLIVHRYELGEHLWGIVQERWKLIESPDGVELFDLVEDPGETVDLSEQHPDLTATLRERLAAHRARGMSPDSAQKDVEIDPLLLQQLRALGYVR